MNLMFLGPPGAGKGTIAKRLSAELGIPHISTGDLFRAAIKEGSALGKKVKNIIDAGDLVPDDVTIEVVRERLAAPDVKDGYIFDGFPRTIPQAEALDEISHLQLVINLTITDAQIIKRLSGRRLCPNCGAGYHVTSLPPKKEGICDVCGTKLTTRKDDAPEAVQHRLDVYHRQTAPLLSHYRDRGLIKDIDGSRSIDSVLADSVQLTRA